MTEPTATFTTEGHTPVLIEDWLPIHELGIESVREAAPIPGQFPKLKTLHVWWARAPLAAANGVVLTSLLPAWSEELLNEVDGLSEALERTRANRPDLRDKYDQMGNGDWYRQWVLWVCGVHGNPIAAKVRIEAASRVGKILGAKAYGYKPAFRNSPGVSDLNVVGRLLLLRWGRLPRILDPTAGGGSIPYSALRYGLPTFANDLNPVAVSILDAGLRAPSHFGLELSEDLQKWGGVLAQRLQERLEPYFAIPDDATNNSYIYANTVACPRTGGPVPLVPNWWLDKKNGGFAVRLEAGKNPDGSPNVLAFHIEEGPHFTFEPDDGTVSGGDAVSPWDGLVIDGEHIKA